MHDLMQQLEQAMAWNTMPVTSRHVQGILTTLYTDWNSGFAVAPQLLEAISVWQS